MKSIYTLPLFLLTGLPAMAQLGAPDPSFGGGDGIVITFFDPYANDVAEAVALQPDGKIVAGGYTRYPSVDADFALARYFADGTLDPGFGTSGKVVTDITGLIDHRDFINCIQIQHDQKILVGGYIEAPAYIKAVLTRYMSNGDLDSTFGTNGSMITSGPFDRNVDLALQYDGKIIVAGNYDVPTVSRYLSDGTPDSTFDADGKWSDLPNWSSISNVKLLPDGKILLGGSRWEYTGWEYIWDFALARLNPDGSPDTTFDDDGRAFFPAPYNDEMFDMDVQADGKIVVAGHTKYADTYFSFSAARFNSDGSVDPGFGSGGRTVVDIAGTYSRAHSIALQNDGKIVLVGDGIRVFEHHYTLVRLQSNGAIDNTFGHSGIVQTRLSQYPDVACESVIQPDGKVVVVGASTNKDYDNFAVVRYDMDLLDTSSTVGYDENKLQSGISVYPNPTSDQVLVSSPTLMSGASFQLIDLQGKQVMVQQNLNGHSFHLDLRGRPAGIYFLEISGTGWTERFKLVKQ